MRTLRPGKPPSAAADPHCVGVAVTGWAVHVPGFDVGTVIDGYQSGFACAPEHAHELLGAKGLLGKEPATRLALCAVHHVLKLRPGAPQPRGELDVRTAVVASSNFGNSATVHNIVQTLRQRGIRDVSALDAPNASSNILASTVAIRFRFGGPNLMVCSGSTSGLDAIAMACLLLRAGRADRVLVVGAEPDDEVASRLHERRASHAKAGRLRAGAASLVLEPANVALATAPLLSSVEPISGVRKGLNDAQPSIFIGPGELASGAGRVIDLSRQIGDTYGAHGVLQVAVGAGLIASVPTEARPSVTVVCGDPVDGWRSVVVSPGRVTEPASEIQKRQNA